LNIFLCWLKNLPKQVAGSEPAAFVVLL
jgi:hypothetical protein